MPRITPDHELAASKDLIGENIDKLRQLFPSIVSEDKIDFSALRQLLGDEVTEDEEYFRFVWPGKRQARAEALKPSTGTLRPAPEESLDWDTTQNLYLEGDNLEVLKLLQRSYAGKVKMIYIDPPYNTGKDFVYKDNYRDNLKNYRDNYGKKDEEGNIVSNQAERNSESDGRYHSNWLNMMYPRLQLARNLLCEDGVLFVSIDNNEVQNLQKLMDEVFGEENFVDKIIWKKRYGGGAKEKYLVTLQEYVLFYSKNISQLDNIYVPLEEESIKRYYTKTDSNSLTRGPYRTHPLEATKSMGSRPNLVYGIPGPNGIEVLPARQWLWSKERAMAALDDGELEFLQSSDGTFTVHTKQYLKDEDGNTREGKAFSIIDNIYTQHGTNEIIDLFNNAQIFSFPKPSKFGSKLVSVSGTVDDDIVLDLFAGSSSLYQGIFQDIVDEGVSVRYIGVQLPELTDEKSEAHKAGYHTIAEIGKERIRRVAQKIWEEDPEKADKLDLGFRVFKLDSSNIEAWDPDPAKLEDNLFANNIKEDRSAYDLVFEILLKYGLDLSLPIAEREGDGHTFYSVGSGALLLCLGRGITRRSAQTLLDWSRELGAVNPKVVFRDTGFTSSVEKTNAYELLRSGGIEDVKSV